MDDLTKEETRISTMKAYFKNLFGKDAEEHTDLFIAYLSEHTNRQLISKLQRLDENFEILNESGFLNRND